MITISTDFPCGNGALLAQSECEDGQYVKFRAETKYYEPQPNWFFFRLNGLRKGMIHFEFANAEQCLDDEGVTGWKDNHPVYRTVGGEWRRVHGVRVELTPERRYRVMFDVPADGAEMEFAYCFPYGAEQLQKTLSECDTLQTAVIGYSGKGREILRVSTNFGDEEKSRRGIYVIARQHAAEVSGAWITDGMMRFLNTEEGRRLTAHQMWWIVPMIDPDGIEEGAYGKDQYLGDFNRAWGKPFPKRLELHAVIHDLDHWQDFSNPGYFLDMHSPGNDKHGIILLLKREMTDGQQKVADAFVARFNEYLVQNGMQQAIPKYNNPGKGNTSSQNGTMASVYAPTVAGAPSVTVETSCWGPVGEGNCYTIADYHKMGECYVRAIADIIK